jgi:tetratricopeptide (TPR) repeat protein
MAAAKQAMRHTERAMLPQLELGAAHRMLGEAYQAVGRYAEAVRHFEESLSILGTIQSRPELGQSLMAYGHFKLGDDRAVGLDYMDRAMQIFKEIDADGWIN